MGSLPLLRSADPNGHLTEVLESTDKRYFRQLLIGRSVTLTAIVLLLIIMELQVVTSAPSLPVFVFLFFMLLMTPLHFYIERSGLAPTKSISLGIVTTDTLLLAVGLYLLGGQNALYGLPAYGILIVMAAVVHSARKCFLIAMLGATSYMLMVLGGSMGWIPIRPQLFPLSLEETFPIASIATTFSLNLVMAIVASLLCSVKDSALSRSLHFEGELQELNEDLERRVHAALGDLRVKNAQLNNTIGHMELYSRAVSHDLRNPLTAASEGLAMGRESHAGQEREVFFELAADNLLRADRMLSGLRELAHDTVYTPSEEPTRIRPAIQGLFAEFPEGLGRLVELAGDDELGSTWLPRLQVEHLFRNLIGNAFSHNSPVELVIQVGRGTSRETEAYFVRDNGSGIREDLLPHIFEPLLRGVESSSGGLGLGLTIAEGIVTNSGGQIWCESCPDEGTTFWFTLPTTPG